MGIFKKTERPVFFPGRTILGKTTGPVIDLGDLFPGDPERNIQGIRVYVDERESREICHAWGWPTEEKFNETVDALIEALDSNAKLKVELAETKAALEAATTLRKYISSTEPVKAAKE